MQTSLRLLSDPHFLHDNVKIPSYHSNLNYPNRILAARKTTIVGAVNRRNRYGMIAKSGKLMLESAYIIASHLRILPEPVDSILREFGAGNGGRNGFWSGFGRGGSDGWRRRRKTRLVWVGILVILGAVGLWWIVGKELALDSDAFFGGLGLVLFGISVEGWRRGARDWILGFCCCAFLVGLVSTKADFPVWLKNIESLKKGPKRKKGRAF
ncbi:hypothetical protein AAHA92_17697 [Salvia divinorum]|uniref:Uncharacterized protein n=1 Tax=Salvia divinorum TaxID=28513 RepID=A0ABD1H036_SALDI